MYIFVYGTLRQGMRLHHYLFQDEFIGDAVLSDATMYDLVNILLLYYEEIKTYMASYILLHSPRCVF